MDLLEILTQELQVDMRKVLVLNLAFLATLTVLTSPAPSATPKVISFVADIWADNWFSLYINGKKVGEDSVPISKEKSFNSERIRFDASYPFTVGLVAKDYVENQSGLEYIGTPRQQIGDGGVILQIQENVSKNFVIGTDSSWKSLVIFRAPLNSTCVSSKTPIQECQSRSVTAPRTWSMSSFKDSSWQNAKEYTESEVGVKEGFLEVNWDSRAKLIWSDDLKLDNTILFRRTITSAQSKAVPKLTISIKNSQYSLLPKDVTCDGSGEIPRFEWSGVDPQTSSLAITMETIPGPPRSGEVSSGNHFYLVAYNIPMNARSLNEATFGKNFQDRLGYTPPCSQGPGLKRYIVTIYALSKYIESIIPITGDVLQQFAAQHLIAKAVVEFGYTRA